MAAELGGTATKTSTESAESTEMGTMGNAILEALFLTLRVLVIGAIFVYMPRVTRPR